jgi:hypothetical protein
MLDLPNPALIGVVHLPPLPGSPRHLLDVGEIVSRAMADARILADAGFDAAIIENFGDAPFFADRIGPVSVAAMTVVAENVRREVGIRLGINALRNDAEAALGIAVAVGAAFVRVNVHTGLVAADQGWITGRADRTMRQRKLLGARVAILADVHVKHGVSISHPNIVRAARDTAYRGLADGLIVTGPATGEAVDVSELHAVREAVPDRRVFVGSGATAETVRSLLASSSGVIVGSGIKRNHDPANEIDAGLARAFVAAARKG